MIIVVTGYRFWLDPNIVEDRLDQLDKNDLIIGVGDCPTGVDEFARNWARKHKVGLKVFVADWDKFDRAAGPIRNKEMINEMRPDLVLAFINTKSRGTKQCAEYAGEQGYVVEPIWED